MKKEKEKPITKVSSTVVGRKGKKRILSRTKKKNNQKTFLHNISEVSGVFFIIKIIKIK